ncbi:coiled-coil domain-containing protein 172 isoform X1 [Oncorhynchus tshawytscha]|uniref:Coiled-coil domain-containing protein 172 n=1 Tax=Oncorhynchus tshawytscha TaxID=74940 RepID=A0A8C8M4K9_ONCTS|nr:coiled-coil domain-containing protein 172 isoform X1 [Oncorhynchus tshawytscha]XP_042179568.1 coiled-coil domain-containing protein 172 isoform X1 [Oncorhynchus tshawytscha]
MSLDTLFQQILLTEQQISEKTRQSQEVKAAIARCQDRVKTLTAKSECLSKELDEQAQHLSETKLQYDLMKKHQVQVEKQAGELLRQQRDLRKHLEKIKKSSKEEQENFMNEIMTFNSDFSLLNNRETVFESQTQSEIRNLGEEVSSLNKEMDSMGRTNTQMKSMQEEKRGLHLELQGLEHIMKDLESQLSEAKSMTESLSAESLMVTQKPLTDSTCLRLKKELEMHKEGELELLREALSSEILFLQSKLSQKTPQYSRKFT